MGAVVGKIGGIFIVKFAFSLPRALPVVLSVLSVRTVRIRS